MNRRGRALFANLALAGALAVAVAIPAPTAAAEPARRVSPSLQPLPTSLLVTIRRGAALESVDAAAAERGLARVAWNATLRTAQYVSAGDTPAGDVPGGGTGSAHHPGQPLAIRPADLGDARRVDGRERSRLARLGAELRRIPGVVAAAPPVELHLLEDPVPPDPTPTPVPSPVPPPNDPLWNDQWGPDAIGARGAWALTRGRAEIVVAVIDSGVDVGHPDLAGRLIRGTDTGSGDRDPSDENGHGTHVAGIVAAATGNARGVGGTAPGVVVMPIKVMNDSGSIWEMAVAEGVSWAVARGARVINMSLGGSSESAAIDAAIDDARAKGVVVVAAAGNHTAGQPDPGVSQPAAYGPVLAVAAVADGGAVLGEPGDPARYGWATFSNTGPQVDLAAPGMSILSTLPRWASSPYGYARGTSMATPFVSAAAALVLSRDPSLTAEQVEGALVATAVDLGPAGPDPETGAGLVRADAAAASIAAPPYDGLAPAVRIAGIADGGVVRGTVDVRFAATDASPIVATRVYRDGRYDRVRRSGDVAVAWRSTKVADGLHRWRAYATDAGLQVGSASARVLVANDRRVGRARTSAPMTSARPTVTRSISLARRTPLVARVRAPTGTMLRVRVVNASGRIVAEAWGSGAAVAARGTLRAGRYTIRARAITPSSGGELRLRAAWLR